MSKPLIIPIFLPNTGCPHRCAFCDQRAITGRREPIPSAASLRAQIEAFLSFSDRQRDATQISFYGGNFLGLGPDSQHFLLKEAARFVRQGSVDSIRFSTRPDTIDPQQLGRIEAYPVSTVELGAQSMDNKILAGVNRGHAAEDTEQAMALLKRRGYGTGLQMMVGLPGDCDEGALESAARIAALSPDFVRIYPTLVLAHSPLADRFKKGDYTPMSLESAVTLVKKIHRLFEGHDIRVIRMGLQATTSLDNPSVLLAGPYHPAFGHLVLSEVFLDKAAAVLASAGIDRRRVTLKTHPASIPKARGHRGRNIDILKSRFGIRELEIHPDSALARDDLMVSD